MRRTPARVTFAGRDITGLPAEKLAPLGFARTFQHGRVFGNLSVLDNVLVGAHTRLAAVRPQWPLIGPIGELALALVRPAIGQGRRGSAARRRDGDPRAVRRAAGAAHQQSGLLALLCEPPPPRDRARAVAQAARAVPRRADRRHEPDRNHGNARDHPHPEGPLHHPADRAQARPGDAALRPRGGDGRRRQDRRRLPRARSRRTPP